MVEFLKKIKTRYSESNTRKVLKTIFRSVRDGWRSRYSHVLYNVYGTHSIVAIAKTNRIRWAGHIERIDGRRHTQIGAEAATYEKKKEKPVRHERSI